MASNMVAWAYQMGLLAFVISGTYRLTSGASFPPRLISGQSGSDLCTWGGLLKGAMRREAVYGRVGMVV